MLVMTKLLSKCRCLGVYQDGGLCGYGEPRISTSVSDGERGFLLPLIGLRQKLAGAILHEFSSLEGLGQSCKKAAMGTTREDGLLV